MIKVFEHRLTEHQVQIIRESLLLDRGIDAEIEALFEVLNQKIHGGKQVVIVRYEHEGA